MEENLLFQVQKLVWYTSVVIWLEEQQQEQQQEQQHLDYWEHSMRFDYYRESWTQHAVDCWVVAMTT